MKKKTQGAPAPNYVKWLWYAALTPFVLLAAMLTLTALGAFGRMPSFEELENPRSNIATEIYSEDGKVLGTFFVQNRSYVQYEELFASDSVTRTSINGREVPPIVAALIATEDARFDSHSGIDIPSLIRVGVKTILLQNRSAGGGSTITQQLAKNLFPMTQAGIHNLKNISEEFGCTIISCKPNIKVQKTLMRKFFEKYGKPTWYVDRLIYTFPLHMAAKFNTPMLCYGENVSFEYGGNADKETYSAMGQIENGVAVGMPMEELLGDGVTEKDLSLTLAPSAEERAKLDPFYMSYFVPWNSYKNYQIAKAHGFHDLTHEWDRTHHAENFDQIDSRAYLVHSWLKYPKFGHAAATDYTARYIRYGMMTREEAIPIIKERDGKLDPLCVRDFCEFCGYTETEFWAILDKFYNRDLFEKNEYGEWQLKHPIWEENK